MKQKSVLTASVHGFGYLALAVVIAAGFLALWHQAKNLESVYHVHVSGANDVRAQVIFPQNQPALAHYTEHLVSLPFIGRDSRPQDRHANAWTSNIAIGYWQAGKPEDLSGMLRSLAAVFKPIKVQKQIAETERKIVLREYEKRMVGNLDAQAMLDMNAFLYAGNIWASASETPEVIEGFSVEQARDFHAATHTPARARLVVVGNVSKQSLQRAIQQAGFPELAGNAIGPPPFKMAPTETSRFAYPSDTTAPRMKWRKVVKLAHPVNLDLLVVQCNLLRDILITNLPGGFAGPLRFDAFIANAFDVAIYPMDESHVEMRFWADAETNVSFSQLEEAFRSALKKSAQGIPPATYARVRERFKVGWPDWDDEESVGRYMAEYVPSRVSELREPIAPPTLRKLDDQMQLSEINALLAALAGPGRTAIAQIGKDHLR